MDRDKYILNSNLKEEYHKKPSWTDLEGLKKTNNELKTLNFEKKNGSESTLTVWLSIVSEKKNI